MNKKLIVANIRQNRVLMTSAGKIGEDIHLGRITLEEGIKRARLLACLNLVASLVAKLAQKHEDYKRMLKADVHNNICTVPEAIQKAKDFGITDLDAFLLELRGAANRHGLTDIEMARRAAAVRAAQASTSSAAA